MGGLFGKDQITFEVSPEEYRQISRAARREEESISSYCRTRVLDGEMVHLRQPNVSRPFEEGREACNELCEDVAWMIDHKEYDEEIISRCRKNTQTFLGTMEEISEMIRVEIDDLREKYLKDV